MRQIVWSSLMLLLLSISPTALAHRNGCHAWHSCPSDRGTYVCGDTGHCGQCPDNQYCLLGKPRALKEQSPRPPSETTPGKARS